MVKILLIEGDNVRELDKVTFAEESKLEEYARVGPPEQLSDVVEGASDLVCIGREVAVPSGAIDLLYIDRNGVLTVVETKLVKNPEIRRTVIGQLIEYASYVVQWSADDVYHLAKEHAQTDLDEVAAMITGEGSDSDDFRTKIEGNLTDGKIRLVIAVDELNETLRATVT